MGQSYHPAACRAVSPDSPKFFLACLQSRRRAYAPCAARRKLFHMEFRLFLDGQFRNGASVRPVLVPYDSAPFAHVHEADPALLRQAIEAANRALPGMRAMTRSRRAEILLEVRRRLLESAEWFAQIIASESGKPIREAKTEVQRAAGTLLFSAQEALALSGQEVPIDASPNGENRMAMVIREPVGVIAAITPFNFPLNLALHKIGPAIAGGNTVVHKPASTTPVSALEIARLFQEAGLPNGALNTMPGPGSVLGEILATHPAVCMITFTGSPEVGIALRQLAGLKRITLELGSNSAVIVAEDADLDLAVPSCVTGAYAHSGQVCISVQRIFVQQGILEAFLDRFTKRAACLRSGHPLESEAEVSSLISPQEAARVETWLQEATAAGAAVHAGGRRDGARMEPTVVTDVPLHTRLFTGEVFGPIAGINSYDSLGDAITLVNQSDFGLQAGIFTRDLQRAFHAARHCQVGGFLINDVPQFRADQMPYGGVKKSGSGREGPHYAIEEMTEPKLIIWRL